MIVWRKQLAILALALSLVLGGGLEVFAVAPTNIITYQGRVLSANGVPVSDATLSMKFFLYTASGGGTCVWSNSSATCDGNTPGSTTARSVSLTSGLFTQNLGDTSDTFAAIADSIFADNATLFLEVIIGTETLSPRRRVTAAPYALNAQTLDGLNSGDFDLDRVYDNDSNSTLAVDGASGLTFTNSGASDITFNLSSTGDFVIQDNGTPVVSITDAGILDIDGEVSIGDGGDAISIDSSDWDITAAGVMTGISGISSDGLITGTLGATFSGAAVSINVFSNFNTSINTNGSTGTVSIGNTSSPVNITSNTLTLTDDNWAISSSGAATFNSIAASSVLSNLSLSNNLLLNIGNAGTDFLSDGGLTLAGDLTVSGDDLTMGTNTSGFILVADGTNYNPVAVSGDMTLSSAGAVTIAANAVALSTDTTGNYVATIADAGSSDLSILGSGSEGAAVTIDIADDSLDLTEFEDSLDLDAATDINAGANLFSVDLDSTGDFAVRDGTTNVVLFEDDSTIDITFPQTGFLTIDAASTSSETTTGVIDLNVSASDAAVDGINIGMTQKDGASGGVDATALEILLTGNDADGDMFGMTVTGAATANATTGTYEALLLLTNNENTSGAVSDAIRISSGASTADSITTGIDFDTTDIRTDIELQNDETISNDTNGTISFGISGSNELNLTAASLSPAADSGLDLGTSSIQFADLYLDGGQLFADNAFDIDVDDNTTAAFTVSEGANEYLRFTTTNGSETGVLGSNGLTQLSLTTDNNATNDINITGGVTITSGSSHNSVSLSSGVDSEVAMAVTANSLVDGMGLSVRSISTAWTEATLFQVNYAASGSLSDGTGTVGDFVSSRTNTSTIGTVTDTFNAFSFMRRSVQNGAGGTLTATGAVLAVTNSAIQTAGTLNDNVDGVVVTMDTDGNGSGMIITMPTVDSPAANSVDRQALVLDVQETSSSDAVFLVRSDSDGTPDTEFRIDNDGDFQYDGTGSSPASDVAEVYRSSSTLVPGDVVSLNATGNLNVSRSSVPYDPKLFGGISTKPALLLGSDIIGYEVALTGRIPMKFSAENGTVNVGDPLTSSSTPGHAMKATQAGMIVGYALEPFMGSGTGTIMAFVNVGWYAGSVLGTDGSSTIATDDVVVASVGTATEQTQTFDSYGLSLRGSAWNGNEAEAVEMMLRNVVEDQDEYRLSVRNTAQTEVAYITNEGTMRIAGDMVIGGRLYPSDRGTPQTSKYIYYDGSEGAAGDFMRTNAKGWATGSYDFAEMFPSSDRLLAGEVVAFAGDGEKVVRATGIDGEQLAGIVSTRPGFLAGENVEGAYPIALAGRVPTRVSGVVEVGDPLTASSIAGIAQKATKTGQIAGYALESYDGTSSDNVILAYVNVGYWAGEAAPVVDNRASQVSGTQDFTALNMSGDIYLSSHQILGIGKLEGAGGLWSLEADGTLKTEGLLKTVTTSYQNEKVETIATTSPEATITLSGTSRLVDGKAEVRFEDVSPTFNDVISAIAPVRVFVTPSGPVSIYVSQKDQNHFIATRFQGEADVEFDWMVVGYRKGYEPVREEGLEGGDNTDRVIPSESLVESRDLEEEVVEVTEVSEAAEESAAPVSPEETISDPATQGDGGQQAEEPPQVAQDPIIEEATPPPAP